MTQQYCDCVKYMYKGHDRTNITVNSGGENVNIAEAKSVNEISEYLEGRHESSTVASFRIFCV